MMRIGEEWRTMRAFFLVISVSFLILMTQMLSVRAARVAFENDFLFFIVPLTLFGVGIGGICTFVARTRQHSFNALFLAMPLAALVALHYYIATYGHVADAPLSVKTLFFLTGFAAYICAGWLIADIIAARGSSFATLYFLDLCGAAVAAIAAVWLLNAIGYEHTVLLACLVALLPMLFLLCAKKTHVLQLLALWVLVTSFSVTRTGVPFGIPCAPEDALYTRTNAFSQLDVWAPRGVSHEDVRKLRAPVQLGITIDCGGGSTVLVAPTKDAARSITKDARSIPLAFVARDASVLITGAGGGVDVLRASLLGLSSIDATELNPNMVAVTKHVAATSTYPYAQSGVRLIVGDTRRLAETTTAEYDLILVAHSTHYGEMPAAVDTISYAHTAEAFEAFLKRLSPHGVLAVVGRPGPITNTPLFNALNALGLAPEGRVAFIESPPRGEARSVDATLPERDQREDVVLVKREPFTAEERAALRALAREREIGEPVYAGPVPLSFENRFYTDDRPYPQVRQNTFYTPEALTWVVEALIAFSFGAFLCAVWFAAYLLPIRGARGVVRIALLALAAGTIGFGFVFLELGLIQNILFVLADSPYAIAILLSAFLFGSGAGALATARMPTRFLLHVVAGSAAILVTYTLLLGAYETPLLREILALGLAERAFSAVILMLVPACAVGAFLPTLVRLAHAHHPSLVPWVWFVDGIFGVVGGIAATMSFHIWGLSTTYPVSAVVYAVAAVALGRLLK